MAYKIQISETCVGCGLCFSSPYIEETSEGMAAVKGAGIIDSGVKDAFVKVMDACPQKAITMIDMKSESSEASGGLQQQLTDQLNKLRNYKLGRPLPQDFPFKNKEYNISIPFASGENRYEYSSESSAESAARSEFNRKMYSQIDYYILQIITQYRVKYVLPYYSKTAEDKSVYLKCNREISEILNNIEDILKVMHNADGMPKDFSIVDVFPDNETTWKMLTKGELLSDEMVSTIRSEFNSGRYSSLDSYSSYWDTDDMEVSAGTDWRGNLKFKDKYCYRNVREAFKELAKDILNACYFVDDRMQDRAAEVAGWLVDAYNEKLDKILAEKISLVENKFSSISK